MSVRDSLRVLVVDDMSTSRGVLMNALDTLGIRCVGHAENGASGFSQAKAKRPHLVLSDLYMPQMNGLELLREIRQDPDIGRMGFILVSGRQDEKSLTVGRSLGMNNFLAKPFRPADLKAAIEGVVGRL